MPLDATNGRNVVKDAYFMNVIEIVNSEEYNSFINSEEYNSFINSEEYMKLEESLINKTYATKYNVGDTIKIAFAPIIRDKPFGIVDCVIVGIDIDVDENNNLIPLTLVTKERPQYILPDGRNTTCWALSNTRDIINSELYLTMPKNKINNRIVKSKKYTKYYTYNYVTYDYMWIPNMAEIGYTGTRKDMGPRYSYYNSTVLLGIRIHRLTYKDYKSYNLNPNSPYYASIATRSFCYNTNTPSNYSAFYISNSSNPKNINDVFQSGSYSENAMSLPYAAPLIGFCLR